MTCTAVAKRDQEGEGGGALVLACGNGRSRRRVQGDATSTSKTNIERHAPSTAALHATTDQVRKAGSGPIKVRHVLKHSYTAYQPSNT